MRSFASGYSRDNFLITIPACLYQSLSPLETRSVSISSFFVTTMYCCVNSYFLLIFVITSLLPSNLGLSSSNPISSYNCCENGTLGFFNIFLFISNTILSLL